MKIGQIIAILTILALLLLGATYALEQKRMPDLSAPLASVVSGFSPEEFVSDDENGEKVIVTTHVIHIVQYTEEGFIPSNITIKQGESVRFENIGDDLMWVADENSTGCLYDTGVFDQCAPSDVYEYRFSEVGEWSFHNTLNVEHVGKVVVE